MARRKRRKKSLFHRSKRKSRSVWKSRKRRSNNPDIGCGSLLFFCVLFFIFATSASYLQNAANNISEGNKVVLFFLVILIALLYLMFFSDSPISIRSISARRKERRISQADIDEMNGIQFEQFCARILVRQGFKKVDVTKASGDQGVDITAEKDKISYAFQCKRYNGPVGNSAVQEVVSGMTLYKCNKAVVITNSYFTPSARELAAANNVELWDRDVLGKMI